MWSMSRFRTGDKLLCKPIFTMISWSVRHARVSSTPSDRCLSRWKLSIEFHPSDHTQRWGLSTNRSRHPVLMIILHQSCSARSVDKRFVIIMCKNRFDAFYDTYIRAVQLDLDLSVVPPNTLWVTCHHKGLSQYVHVGYISVRNSF